MPTELHGFGICEGGRRERVALQVEPAPERFTSGTKRESSAAICITMRELIFMSDRGLGSALEDRDRPYRHGKSIVSDTTFVV